MSSPRRAAKDALDRAAKAARGSRPAVPAAKASAKIAVADAKRVTAAMNGVSPTASSTRSRPRPCRP